MSAIPWTVKVRDYNQVNVTEPKVEFVGASPYDEYVKASVLTHLQQPWSDDPAEMAFLVTTQVMELWFTLLVHEWQTARDALTTTECPTRWPRYVAACRS